MRARLNIELAPAYLMWTVDILSRRDCGLILAGARVCDSERRLTYLLERLEQERLIERRGRAAQARFAITAEGRRRVAITEPTRHWNQPWRIGRTSAKCRKISRNPPHRHSF